jgi:hypothetical protein
MRAALWFGLLALWVITIGASMGALWAYKMAPGAAATPPAAWPSASRLRRTAGRPTLVMFAHPGCPCTRASLSELARLVARFPQRMTVYVLFTGPAEAPAIPGVEMRSDADGAEAARLGARTSGQALLYSAAGTLVFSGGLTGARGHEGDNPGRAAIAAFLEHGEASRPATPVFGCALQDPG